MVRGVPTHYTGITLGQGNQLVFNATQPATTSGGAFSGATPAGNYIIVFALQQNLANVTIADTDGSGHSNSYTQINSLVTAPTTTLALSAWYAKNAVTGTYTITATSVGAVPQFLFLDISDWSGIDATTPLHDSTNGTGLNTALSGGTPTVGTSGSLLFGAFYIDGSGNAITHGTGFADNYNNAFNYGSEYQIVSSDTQLLASLASIPQNYAAIAAVFNPVTAGTSGLLSRRRRQTST